MADQLPCKKCGHYAVMCDDEIRHYKEELDAANAKIAELKIEIDISNARLRGQVHPKDNGFRTEDDKI